MNRNPNHARMTQMAAVRETGLKQEIARYGNIITALETASNGIAASIDSGEEPSAKGIDALCKLLIDEFKDNQQRLQHLI